MKSIINLAIFVIGVNAVISGASMIRENPPVGIIVMLIGFVVMYSRFLKNKKGEYMIPPKKGFQILLEKEKLNSGRSVFIDGVQITPRTIVRRYVLCMSFVFLTKRSYSDVFFSRDTSSDESKQRILCFLMTILLGWWAIPFGPFLTLHTLWVNLTGGKKQTVMEFIADISAPPPSADRGRP
ncbi:MAG: hypothetical protein AAB592_01050 [Patescibacteria group bacterium]